MANQMSVGSETSKTSKSSIEKRRGFAKTKAQTVIDETGEEEKD